MTEWQKEGMKHRQMMKWRRRNAKAKMTPFTHVHISDNLGYVKERGGQNNPLTLCL